jgi:hypothetical protein
MSNATPNSTVPSKKLMTVKSHYSPDADSRHRHYRKRPERLNHVGNLFTVRHSNSRTKKAVTLRMNECWTSVSGAGDRSADMSTCTVGFRVDWRIRQRQSQGIALCGALPRLRGRGVCSLVGRGSRRTERLSKEKPRTLMLMANEAERRAEPWPSDRPWLGALNDLTTVTAR